MKRRIVRVVATVGSLAMLGAAPPVLAGSPMGSSRAETCVKGVVTEVNQADRTILMVDALGREALIRYDGETLFMVRGEPSGRGELRKGAQITVWGAAVLGGQRTAQDGVCPISFIAGQVEVVEAVALQGTPRP